MKIAIRKEPNGLIYIDKNICNDERFSEGQLRQEPYNFSFLEIEDTYSDCEGVDFDENLEFSAEKYFARKSQVNLLERIAILKQTLNKYKEDVEQVEMFDMQRDDYEQKKKACRDIILELRDLEKRAGLS